MPYVPADDRPILNTKIDKLADYIVSSMSKNNKDTDVSLEYRKNIVEICDTLYELEWMTHEKRKSSKPKSAAEEMAYQIFNVADKYGYRGAWLGELNYSLTMLIQVVPYKMVKSGAWKEEIRYWLYAQTVGALENSKLELQKKFGKNMKEWVLDGFVGVLTDIKDEYKRRVNPAYESVQIKKSGDCYITPYHTELEEVKDSKGNVIGWRQLEKDYRKTHTVKEVKDNDNNVIGWQQVPKE